MRARKLSNYSKVGVIGSGYIGSVLAGTIALAGPEVIAIDTNTDLVNRLNDLDCPIPEPGLQELLSQGVQSGTLRFASDLKLIGDVDVILITVGTPLRDDGSPDTTQLMSACESLSPHVADGQLVIVKSTVPPGTTRNIVAKTLCKRADVRVAFSPERLAEGNAINELKRLPIIVGGVNEQDTTLAGDFWREILDVQVIEVSSAETAEMVKLANNLWIDVNIALAHDLARVADALPHSIDILEVISGANTLPKGSYNVNILTPSNGVGGYCLTKDPWFVHWLGTQHGMNLLIPEASRRTNDMMPSYCVDRILGWLHGAGMAGDKSKVTIMGLSFKSGSGDLRFTPVLPLLEGLGNGGIGELLVYDPLVESMEAERLGVVLCDAAEEALRDTNVVVFTTGHPEFLSISVDELAKLVKPGCLIFDGRRYFSRDEIDQIKGFGLKYLGVGR